MRQKPSLKCLWRTFNKDLWNYFLRMSPSFPEGIESSQIKIETWKGSTGDFSLWTSFKVQATVDGDAVDDFRLAEWREKAARWMKPHRSATGAPPLACGCYSQVWNQPQVWATISILEARWTGLCWLQKLLQSRRCHFFIYLGLKLKCPWPLTPPKHPEGGIIIIIYQLLCALYSLQIPISISSWSMIPLSCRMRKQGLKCQHLHIPSHS